MGASLSATDQLLYLVQPFPASEKWLIRIGHYLKVLAAKRPSNGMSGLVRGSRRKAVFAFNGPFSEEACLIYAFGHLLLPRIFESVGKNRKPPSTTRFLATKPQVAEAQTRGLVGGSRFFPHFRNRLPEVCGKFRNPQAHRPFRAKKPQVEALLHSGVLDMF